MSQNSTPLSQNETKIIFATRDECIAEIRRMVEANPDHAITRNYFRINSGLAESAWNKHFGTFSEFRRGSGVQLSRHARRMEGDTAKHSSVTAFRRMNESKSGYEGKYLRPYPRRFQTILHVTDIHDRECDPFWRRVFLAACQRIQPEKIIFGGDLWDAPEFGKYGVDPREWDAVGRIRWVHKLLEDVRTASPDSELVLVEGNHEYRLLRHLAEATPAMQAVLADLHGFTVPKLLGLDTYEVNYISRTDLGTFTKSDITKEIGKNYYIAHNCYLAHHFPEGEKLGFPGGHGHHHRHFAHQHFSPAFGSFEWHQIGCGHRRQATYCSGEQWGMGFMIAHIDTHAKHVVQEYVQIRDFAMLGGVFYERLSTET